MIITTSDNVKLNVKKTGKGKVVLFVHEFGGDQRSWKPQVSYFSRRYECITFNARGYPPSGVPKNIALPLPNAGGSSPSNLSSCTILFRY